MGCEEGECGGVVSECSHGNVHGCTYGSWDSRKGWTALD